MKCPEIIYDITYDIIVTVIYIHLDMQLIKIFGKHILQLLLNAKYWHLSHEKSDSPHPLTMQRLDCCSVERNMDLGSRQTRIGIQDPKSRHHLPDLT